MADEKGKNPEWKRRSVAMSQERAVAEAAEWSRHHAERLGCTVEELAAATLRGWFAEDIVALPASEAVKIFGAPIDGELTAGIERIKATPVSPIKDFSHSHLAEVREAKPRRPNRKADEGPSIKETAFLNAKS